MEKPMKSIPIRYRKRFTTLLLLQGAVISVYAQSTSPLLPFDMPSRQVLTASPKKVFAHYFTQFPISIDNDLPGNNEYYQQYWLPPGAMEGQTDHRVYGGFLRDRPLYRIPLTGDYALQDKKEEIRQALEAGLDGFTIDMLQIGPVSASKPHWSKTLQLFDAADAVGQGFKLLLMPDGTASATASVLNPDNTVNSLASASALADNIATLINRSAMYKSGNRLMIAPFAPEKWPNKSGRTTTERPAFWSAVKRRLQTTYNTPTDLWMCYVDTWTAAQCAPALDSLAYGHGRWGDRDPVTSAKYNSSNAGAPAHSHTVFKKPWMHPVAPQDNRPNQDKYTEAWNTENLRASWMAAINGNADWVQNITWNDYAEHAHMAPSRNHGYVWLDLNVYFLVRYKTGAWPVIIRDGLYLLHRIQPSGGVTYTGGQTRFQTLAGATPAKDEVEVVAFLTAPATIVLNVGGRISTFSGATGLNIFKAPLAIGNISVSAIRNNVEVAAVASPFPVSATQVAQDMHYRAVSSLRENTVTAPAVTTADTAAAFRTIPENNPVTVYPNPVKDVLTVLLHADMPGEAVFTLTDLSGSMVLRNNYALVKGNNKFELRTAAVKNGMYLLSCTNGRFSFVKKILVQGN